MWVDFQHFGKGIMDVELLYSICGIFVPLGILSGLWLPRKLFLNIVNIRFHLLR